MSIKRNIHIFILASAGLVTGYYSIYGPTGIKKYRALGKHIQNETNEIEKIKHDIEALEHQLQQWNTDPFEKEKVGRTDLQLACSNELIYLLPEDVCN